MFEGPVGGHASVGARRSISYQATPAGPARPTGSKTHKSHTNRGHRYGEPTRQTSPKHDTEPLWADRTRTVWPGSRRLRRGFQVFPDEGLRGREPRCDQQRSSGLYWDKTVSHPFGAAASPAVHGQAPASRFRYGATGAVAHRVHSTAREAAARATGPNSNWERMSEDPTLVAHKCFSYVKRPWRVRVVWRLRAGCGRRRWRVGA